MRLFFLILLSALTLTVTPPVFAVGDQPEGQGQTADSAGGLVFIQTGDSETDTLWVDEKNGRFIPLDTEFTDEEGQRVTLESIIDRPTLLLPIYFYCPNSCSLNLMNLAMAIKRSNLEPGQDFKAIAFSFNAEEDAEDAKIAKQNYLRLLPEDFEARNWKFLTGDKKSIEAVTGAIGYRFEALEDGIFTHPSAMVAVAADGKIIKYIYGSFVTGDVDMAIAEAEKGTPGISVKRFLGYCFNYDPSKSRSVFKYMKIGALVGFAVLGLLFVSYVRRSDKNRKGSSRKDQR